MTSLKNLLREAGFLPWIPEEPSKPDIPTVDLPFDNERMHAWPSAVTLLCANQCVRDDGHHCGIEIEPELLLAGASSWVPIVGVEVPWMVLSWGPHLHQLPYCSVNCLIEFTIDRAARSEAAHGHSH